jgi:dienelactone hydrolase
MSSQPTQSPGAVTATPDAMTAMPGAVVPPTGTAPAMPPAQIGDAGSAATPGLGSNPAPDAGTQVPDAATQMPDAGTTPRGQLPPVSDYEAPGPFKTIEVDMTGPEGGYTMHRPDPLGENGFKHPILTWGNGVLTGPWLYTDLLAGIASHGIVVIASDNTAVGAEDLTKGLDWLIAENKNPSSNLYQKLDTARGVSMGFSLGGAASVNASTHPSVVTTIAMHPAPGAMGASIKGGPLLLFSGTADTICPTDTTVQPVYDAATVPTFFGVIDGAIHGEPVLNGGREYGPSVAWLRLHLYGEDAARDYFYGATCKICASPWMTQRKNGFK